MLKVAETGALIVNMLVHGMDYLKQTKKTPNNVETLEH